MGFLESLASGILEGGQESGDKKGEKLSTAQIGQFVQAAAGIVAKIGLPKLIEMFKKAGLEDKVMSWIGKGKNKSVTGSEVQQAVGSKIIGELAKKTGIDAPAAAAALAKYLPAVVDHLTPDGEADDDKAKASLGGFDLGDIGKLLGSALGK